MFGKLGGSFGRPGIVKPVASGGGGGFTFTNAEAETLVAAMSSTPDDTRKGHIDTLVGALKTASVWSELDVLYLLAAADSQAALLNWKNPATFTAIAVNTPTFTADRGYTGDGSSSRLRTQYTPSADGVKFTQDNASQWAWSLTDGQSTASIVGSATSPQSRIAPRNASDMVLGIINDGTGTTTANADGRGFFGMTRPNSATKRFWRNGAQLGSDFARASTGLTNQEQWICGANATVFSSRQIAAAAWGANLDATKSADFYNAMLAYMQAVGAA